MKMIYKALLSIIILAGFYSNCFSQATLSIGTVNGTPGNSISIPIQATGIADMTGFQFTITYDKSKLTYVNCTNWVNGLNSAQVQINPLDGKLTFVYTDAAINIANGKFFDLNFTVINGTSGNAEISWSDSPTQRELSNSIPNEISCGYSNGAVVISGISFLAPVASAATNIAQTSFTANWNSSATATGYRLDVALDNGFTNYLTGYQNKDVGNLTTYQISGCLANTIYYYRVKAYNAVEISGSSNTISLTTLQSSTLVPPVATIATNITQTGFSANWNSSATATGYRLDVALDNGFTNYLTGYQNKDVGNVTTYQISGCLANTIYYYRVKAYNTEITSGISNTINSTTLSTQNSATLTIGNTTGTGGNTVSIPVTATNLSDVVGFQFTIAYDKTKLSYVNCTNWVNGLNASQVQINSLDGKLTFVYTDAAINIANGKFFDLNFTVLNGTSGNAVVSWSDSPTQRELSNSIPNEISCIYSNGEVVISSDICTAPTSPISVTASQTTITSGQSTTLQVNGGALNSASNWVWYTGSCGGSQVGTGTTLSVSPTSTTIYYVLASACGSTTTCRSVLITVSNCITPGTPAKVIGTMTSQTTANLTWWKGNPIGGPLVTYYWVVGTSPTVTYNNGVAQGTTQDTFATTSGLTAGTNYYLRVFANANCNSIISDYKTSSPFSKISEEPQTVKDYDGNEYTVVKIGSQLWLGQNLKTTKYNDGTAIPLVTGSNTWSSLTTPGYCWYNNDINNKNPYGALYNWYAVNAGKLCPIGWHVPSRDEWLALTNYLGGLDNAGGKLKESGTLHWNSPNKGATNETGFTAIPGGMRFFNGEFRDMGKFAIWRSSSIYDSSYGWSTYLHFEDKEGLYWDIYYDNRIGYSVRCLCDLTVGNKNFTANDLIKIYPNPASKEIFVECLNGSITNCSIEIYNMEGKKVKTRNNVDLLNKQTIKTDDLISGFYFVRMYSDKVNINQKIIIKQE